MRFGRGTSAYKNNRLEQDHRGVKGRIRCMRGFKNFGSAERFCRSYDELRNLLRLRTRHNQHVPASRRRLLHLRRALAWRMDRLVGAEGLGGVGERPLS
jgi:putative transposase